MTVDNASATLSHTPCVSSVERGNEFILGIYLSKYIGTMFKLSPLRVCGPIQINAYFYLCHCNNFSLHY